MLTLESKLMSVKEMPNNLIQNPMFQNGITNWTKSGACTTNDKVQAVNGNNTFKFIGDPNESKNLAQTISKSGTKGDIYTFCGWVKSTGVPNEIAVALDSTMKSARILVRLYGTDGTNQEEEIRIEQDTNRMAICVKRNHCQKRLYKN